MWDRPPLPTDRTPCGSSGRPYRPRRRAGVDHRGRTRDNPFFASAGFQHALARTRATAPTRRAHAELDPTAAQRSSPCCSRGRREQRGALKPGRCCPRFRCPARRLGSRCSYGQPDFDHSLRRGVTVAARDARRCAAGGGRALPGTCSTERRARPARRAADRCARTALAARADGIRLVEAAAEDSAVLTLSPSTPPTGVDLASSLEDGDLAILPGPMRRRRRAAMATRTASRPAAPRCARDRASPR